MQIIGQAPVLQAQTFEEPSLQANSSTVSARTQPGWVRRSIQGPSELELNPSDPQLRFTPPCPRAVQVVLISAQPMAVVEPHFQEEGS